MRCEKTALMAYLAEYVESIEKIFELMRKAHQVQTKEEFIKIRKNRPVGTVGTDEGTGHYAFQGRGCRYWNDTMHIKWDFGHDDLWYGIDPWLLSNYIHDNHDVPEDQYTGAVIREIFNQMVKDEEMEEKYELFYLKNRRSI